MGKSRFSIYKYVKIEAAGWRYCRAVFHENRKKKQLINVSEPNDVIEVDFDTILPGGDRDFDPDAELVRIPASIMRSKKEDNRLLDLSDEGTLDKLATGGFYFQGKNKII